MNRKQWVCLALAMLFGALALIVGLVVVIDPFEIYHQATAFIPPITNGTQIYSNAGIAKNYDYDSVIIGSSMTENFTPSQFDALFGGSFIKLPINAGSPFNHKQMMDLAFGSHEIRRVVYGIDIELMTYFYTTPKCEMPDYLYDDLLLNDVRYWFNQSVLAKYIPACLSTLGQSDPDQRDTMYTWGDMYSYGRNEALAGITFTSETVGQAPLEEEPQLSQQIRLNVEYNILPYIEAHPDTEFIFFFPPYSLAFWYTFYQQGTLHDHINQKEAIISALLPYDNVQVYDFQARMEWITDLDNYIDSSHYGPWINEAMACAMSAGDFRITSLEQAKAHDDALRAGVNQIVSAGAWPDVFQY